MPLLFDYNLTKSAFKRNLSFRRLSKRRKGCYEPQQNNNNNNNNNLNLILPTMDTVTSTTTSTNCNSYDNMIIDSESCGVIYIEANDNKNKNNNNSNDNKNKIDHIAEKKQYYCGGSKDSIKSASKIRTSRSHESLRSMSSSNIQSIQFEKYSSQDPNSISIKKLHSSLLGHDHCFVISSPHHGSKYYSCRNSTERDQWMQYVRKTIRPMERHTKRTEESLNVSIQEMKKGSAGLSKNKTSGGGAGSRCFCEISLDKKLYARSSSCSDKTTERTTTTTYFWGESFQFNNLNGLQEISIDVFREKRDGKRKRNDKNILIGSVLMNVDDLKGASGVVDKWMNVVPNSAAGQAAASASATTSSSLSSSSSSASTHFILPKQKSLDMKHNHDLCPLLRVTAHYEQIDILPLASYDKLIKYIEENYMKVISLFEARILKVKDKEQLASCLVHIMRSSNKCADFLATIVTAEVMKSSNCHLALRGNSVASKAMERFMNLIGERYIHDTLSEFITTIIENATVQCEVDGSRLLNNVNSLEKNQENLKRYVDIVMKKIFNSTHYFPNELRQVFTQLRKRLEATNNGDLIKTLLSACIFLRFICPAILSPSMHGLAKKLPGDRTRRNLTLVAKVVQNLANFSHFGTKEEYMLFFNTVVDSYIDNMRKFLNEISTDTKCNENDEYNFASDVDIGKHLSILHSLLERLSGEITENEVKDSISDLSLILAEIRHELDNGISPSADGGTPNSRHSNTSNSSNGGGGGANENNSNINNSENIRRKKSSSHRHTKHDSVRSIYDNVDTYGNIRESNKMPPDHHHHSNDSYSSTTTTTDEINSSWNVLVSHAVNQEETIGRLTRQRSEFDEEDDFQVEERASDVSAIASSGYQSLAGVSPTEIIHVNNPPNSQTKHLQQQQQQQNAAYSNSSPYSNYYRSNSRSSTSSESSPTAANDISSYIYNRHYRKKTNTPNLSSTSTPPKEFSKSVVASASVDKKDGLDKLRRQLARAENRLAYAEKSLEGSSRVVKDKDAGDDFSQKNTYYDHALDNNKEEEEEDDDDNDEYNKRQELYKLYDKLTEMDRKRRKDVDYNNVLDNNEDYEADGGCQNKAFNKYDVNDTNMMMILNNQHQHQQQQHNKRRLDLIDVTERKMADLDAANGRLLSALDTLKKSTVHSRRKSSLDSTAFNLF